MYLILVILGVILLGRTAFMRQVLWIILPLFIQQMRQKYHNSYKESPHAQTRTQQPTGEISLQEAREILGIPEKADRKTILKAHRELMKRLHPDTGGSTYFASKLNAARDILLQQEENT